MIRPLLLCGLILTGSAAFAQTAAPTPDELLALNYYVQQKDQPAIDAELRRLGLKYPQWQPPADLGALAITAPTTEIDEIYRLIAAGTLVEARTLLDATRAKFPTWTAPEDMVTLLEMAEGQARFEEAITAGQLDEAIAIASSVPGLLRCDRINNVWRIADSQTKAGRNADAVASYRAILSACVTPADVIATLEKADAAASEAEIVEMIDTTIQRLPAMTPDLEALRLRLLAGRGHNEIALPAGTIKPEPRPAAPATAAADPVTPAPAPAPAPVPETAPETAVVAPSAPAPAPAPRAGSGGGGGGGAVQSAADAGDWSRCLQLSTGSRSAAVVYQRGWCAYNLDQPMEAINAFQTAMAAGLNATQNRDARYGMALAYLKMHMTEEAAQIAARTDFTHKQRVDIERQILDQRAVAAYNRKDYRKSISYLDALEGMPGGLRRDLEILRAYALLNSGSRGKARKEFQRLNSELSTDETRQGLAASRN